MKKSFSSLLILLFSLSKIYAQVGFEKVYGGDLPDWFRSVIATSDGGILAVGGTKSFGFGDINQSDGYVVKLNASGDTLWTRNFGEYPYTDEAYAALENTSGYLVAGWNVTDTPVVSYDYYAEQFDINGNKLWDRFYGSTNVDYCNAAIIDNNGRTVLCGGSNGYTYGAFDLYAVKIDANGNKIADAHFGGTNHDYASGIIQTSDGGYAMVGYTISDLANYDIYVVKTDSNLVQQWTKHYGGGYDDFGYSIAEDVNGNLWILGSMETPDSMHMVIIKTDANGDNPVMKFPGRTVGDFGYSIRTLADGGFLIGGVTGELGKGNEMLLEKLNTNGDSLWTRHFGGTQNESGLGVTTDADDNILLAGQTEGFGVNQFDAYLVKVDAFGNIPCPSDISFTADPSPSCAGDLVNFKNTTVSSQDFTWDENGDGFSNNVDASYLFNSAGTYTIGLFSCNNGILTNITVNPKPATHFTYTHTGTTVNFSMDAGLNAQSRSWNFGDGSPLNNSQNNPSHTYANLGAYWVTLEVTNTNGCDSTYAEQIDLLTGIDEVDSNTFSLFPNPAHGLVTLNHQALPLPVTVELQTADGRMISQFSSKNSTDQISLDHLTPGLYLIYIREQTGNLMVKKLEVY